MQGVCKDVSVNDLEIERNSIETEIPENELKVIRQWLTKDIHGMSDTEIARSNNITRKTVCNIRERNKRYIEIVQQLNSIKTNESVVTETVIRNGDISEEFGTLIHMTLENAKRGSVKHLELCFKHYDSFKKIYGDISSTNIEDIDSIIKKIDSL